MAYEGVGKLQRGRQRGLETGKRCSDCRNIGENRTTSKGRRYYCKEKGIWIPERKYNRKRKCGRFNPLAYTGG